MTGRILEELKSFRDLNETKKQKNLAANFLEILLNFGDLEKNSGILLKLAKNLWIMVEKQQTDPEIVKFLQNLRDFVAVESKYYSPLSVLAQFFVDQGE